MKSKTLGILLTGLVLQNCAQHSSPDLTNAPPAIIVRTPTDTITYVPEQTTRRTFFEQYKAYARKRDSIKLARFEELLKTYQVEYEAKQ